MDILRPNTRETGAHYEQMAGAYLERQGYRIQEYNFSNRLGEIDVIAWDEGTLVFCEVKYRGTSSAGSPLEAVDKRKQRQIIKCAQYYLMIHGLENVPCRFDVVGIQGRQITLLRDAFWEL